MTRFRVVLPGIALTLFVGGCSGPLPRATPSPTSGRSAAPSATPVQTGAVISGEVRDSRPAESNPTLVLPYGVPVLPGAVIRITNLGLTATSGPDGRFKFTGVDVAAPCILIDVQASAPGFGTFTETGIPVYPEGTILQIMLNTHPQAPSYTAGGAAGESVKTCHHATGPGQIVETFVLTLNGPEQKSSGGDVVDSFFLVTNTPEVGDWYFVFCGPNPNEPPCLGNGSSYTAVVSDQPSAIRWTYEFQREGSFGDQAVLSKGAADNAAPRTYRASYTYPPLPSSG